jgi:4'-phosphopantetheinyl transferase
LRGHALQFNLSHSQDLALYAIGRERAVGIDVERIRPVPDAEQIVGRFFSFSEHALFRALPPRQKLEGFFNCWTRKEAYLKARGEGLDRSLSGFDVTLAPGEPARLLADREDPLEVERWSFRALHPASDYSAALAVEGRGWHFVCWQWSG